MKKIWLSVWNTFFVYSSFLFAHGKPVYQDTIPSGKLVKQLPSVVLRRHALAGRLSGDTLIYDAQRYARPSAFRLEELIQEVPGFRVDGEGRIYFNGKEISRIMIDGEDLSGEHYRLLSRNLRSMMVERLELIQNHQQNRLLKGFDQAGTPAINIKIKKEYKGRASGSVSNGIGTRRIHQVNLESVWLKDSLKQMTFLNRNNTGANGVSDRWGQASEDKPLTLFDVHPFPFILPPNPIGLSTGQTIQNNDLSATSLSSFKTAGGVKINLAANLGKYQLEQEQLNWRTLLLQETNPFLLWQEIGVRRATKATSFHASWGKDHGEHHFVNSVLQIDMDHSQHHHVENRSGVSNYAMEVQRQEKYWRGQWDRTSTRKLNRGVFLHENSIAWGKLSAATTLTLRNESDSLMEIPLQEKMSRKGWLLANHLGFFVSHGNTKWKYGWRSSIESVNSSVVSSRLVYRQYKSYPYAAFIWSPQKRIVYSTQAAGGIVLSNQRHDLQFIHSIEQRLQWKFKRLLQVQLSSGLKKQSGDLRNLVAGPFTTHEGVFIQGNRQLTLPTSFHFSIGATQVDLHAGRNWSLMLQYIKRENDLSRAINVNSSSESWDPVLLGTRHTWSCDLQGEQYLMFLKSKIRFHWNGTQSVLPQLVNRIYNNTLFRMATTDLRIIHQSSRRVGFEIQYHHLRSRHDLMNKSSSKNHLQQKTILANVWWKIHPMVYATLTYGQLLNSQSNRNSMLDLSLYTDIGKRWKLSLAGQNLLNQSSYRVIIADDLGIKTIDQRLNGRRILLTGRYLF